VLDAVLFDAVVLDLDGLPVDPESVWEAVSGG
jgi:hypothetical protein